MTISVGVNKKIAFKRETAWGTPASASGAKYLRRVTADFNLKKDNYQSEELRTDYQVVDMRHGVRRADGSLSAEFSPGSYSEFMAAALRKDFATITLGAAVSSTVTVTGSVYKIVRSTGSWITDGVKVGMVVRASGLTTSADNGKNLLVVAVTALEATVVPLNGSTMTAQGTGSSVTLTAPGKNSYIPETGHTSDSFTIEQWFSDIAQSEVYSGMKVNTMGISIPASGMAKLDFGFMGKDLAQTGVTQYFTTPTAAGTSGIFAGVNGVVVFNGTPVAVITDANISVNSNLTDATVLGSNSIAEVFSGRLTTDGSLSVYFQDATIRDTFNAETEVSLIFTLTTNNTATADFTSITLPRVKLSEFSKGDGAEGITASANFTALKNTSGSGADLTTICIQDSLA